jgi:Fe-S-cluster-containing dehydrogenase component
MRLGMVIDLKRCIGCYGCQLSCKAEHGTPPGVFRTRITKPESGQYPTVSLVPLPVQCNHCDDAPCVKACPTGASFVWDDTGIVDIDPDKCVGCRTCMMACPYSNRYFIEEQNYYAQGPTRLEQYHAPHNQVGTVTKCDFCRDRVMAGKLPACVANCPTIARHFGDLDDPSSEVSRLIRERGGFVLHPEQGTKPRVYYLPA